MIVIDSEFQSLIPPLSDDEYRRLEKSILAEGVRNPIITWNGTIIDGHNRYNICDEHGIKCPQVERKFESRDAAKIWIINNQLGRRNLEAGQKAALVIERNEAKVRERARLRKKSHGNTAPGRKKNTGDHLSPSVSDTTEAPLQEKGRTAEILAKQANVGSATIKRVLKVRQEDPELYDKVRSGEVSSFEAYRQVTSSKANTVKDDRRICKFCGKPIDEGKHYQDKLNWCYECGLKHATKMQRKYRDAGHDLRNNKPQYTIESLLTELQASAENLQTAWNESLLINEGMGVQLTRKQKNRLKSAANGLIKQIQKIREESTDGR